MRLVSYITCIELIAQVSLTWWSSFLFLDVLILKLRINLIILPTDWIERKKIKLPSPYAKNTLSTIAAPATTSSGSFEVVFSNKDEIRIRQLFMRSINRAL